MSGFLLAVLLAGASRGYEGRVLVDVLDELRRGGLNVLYSSAVVTPEIVVTVEPGSREPRAILDEILPPLGLAARTGAGGSILIVRGATAAPVLDRGYSETIEVTPSRHAIVTGERAATRTIERADAVRIPATGGDVSRVVEWLPGLAAADNSAAFHARGADTRDASLVLDGLELYEPFHLFDFQSPFSFVNEDIVEQVDFLGGSFTVDRGDRHGAFVELTTDLPAEPARSRVEVGTLNARATYARSFGDRTLLVSGRAWYPQAATDTIEFGEDGFDPTFADVYAKFTAAVSPRTLLSAHALFAADRVSFRETGGNETVDSSARSVHLWLRARQAWSAACSSDLVVSLGRWKRERSGISEPNDEPLAVDDRRTVDFLGLTEEVAWTLSSVHVLRAGFGARPMDAGYTYERGVPGSESVLTLDPSGTSWSGWLSHRAAWSEHVATETGLRFDRQSYTSEDQLSPRTSWIWRPRERTEVRVGIGRFFQSQRIYELQVEDDETAFHAAERSRQADLTIVQRSAHGYQVRIDGYARRLERVQPRWENLFNPIELFPETETDRVLVAPSSASMRGVELLFQGPPGGALQWWASYAWSSAEDEIDGEHVPRSWDQTHAGKALLSVRLPRGFRVSAAAQVRTGWPTTPVTAVAVDEPIPGPRNSARLPNYARLDVKVSSEITFEHRGRLRFELEVLNVTDRRNACCVNDLVYRELPDGSIDVEPELGFWLGATPLLGVVWEF